jgi:hypothetical protein
MGMRAVFITALSAVLLVYADMESWPAFAIIFLVCLASAAVSLAAEKYSAYASGFVAMSLIVCDALLRHYEATASSLHNSVLLGDMGYAICLFATGGWIGGWFLRRKHVVQGKMEIFDAPRRTCVISPVFARRPRASIE